MAKIKKVFIVILIVSFFIPTSSSLSYANKDYLKEELNLPNYNIRGVKVFSANNSFFIKEKIREKENISNKNKNFYFIRGVTKYQKEDILTEREKAIIEEELVYVLKNIDVSDEILEGLFVFISPYSIKSRFNDNYINAYYTACLSNCEENNVNKMIVLAIKDTTLFDINDYIYRAKVRRTILHEIGHLINRSFINLKGDSNKFWEEIETIYPELKNNKKDSWSYSKKENFAEDMVVILGEQLDRKPYFYKIKNTAYRFNPEMKNLFLKYNKEMKK